MKPVAWIKIRELSYMKAVAEHGKDDWRTNLGLKPEPDDEGLYTETQVQRMIELLECCENEMLAAERERCAKVCEEIDVSAFGSDRPTPNDCANAIRAMEDK